jgi:IS5 family transposase
MDATIPWSRRVGLIEPFTYSSSRGRKPKALETMLRMHLLQAWFSLSDEGVEDAIYDSYAMHRALKGNQWYFGMKAHIGVDAGAGYVHSMTATAASVHDLDQITHLVRADDEVVYADAGYQGVERRPDVADDPRLSQVEFRVAARKSKLAAMAGPDRVA